MSNALGNSIPPVPGQVAKVNANPPNNLDQQPDNRPRLRNRSGADTEADVNQWRHDARALDRKLDDLISKLDALIYELDCCLGNIAADQVLHDLASKSRNLLNNVQTFKVSFAAFNGVIKGASVVAERLQDGAAKTALQSRIREVQSAIQDFVATSNPRIVRRQVGNPSEGQRTASTDSTDSTDSKDSKVSTSTNSTNSTDSTDSTDSKESESRN